MKWFVRADIDGFFGLADIFEREVAVGRGLIAEFNAHSTIESTIGGKRGR